jgi:hypothetical protein
MSIRIKLYYFPNFTAADQDHDGFELAVGLYMTCSSELASQLSFSPTLGNQVMGPQIIGVRNWQGVAA